MDYDCSFVYVFETLVLSIMSISTQVNLLQKKLDAWDVSVRTAATEIDTFLGNRLAVTTSSEAVAKTNEMFLVG